MLGSISGNICYVPVNRLVTNPNARFQPTDSNGAIVVKLKRKAECESQVFFEHVRPRIVQWFLNYLRNCNHLYRGAEMDEDKIPCSLKNFENVESNFHSNLLLEGINRPIELIPQSIPATSLGEKSNCLDMFSSEACEAKLI